MTRRRPIARLEDKNSSPTLDGGYILFPFFITFLSFSSSSLLFSFSNLHDESFFFFFFFFFFSVFGPDYMIKSSLFQLRWRNFLFLFSPLLLLFHSIDDFLAILYRFTNSKALSLFPFYLSLSLSFSILGFLLQICLFPKLERRRRNNKNEKHGQPFEDSKLILLLVHLVIFVF